MILFLVAGKYQIRISNRLCVAEALGLQGARKTSKKPALIAQMCSKLPISSEVLP